MFPTTRSLVRLGLLTVLCASFGSLAHAQVTNGDFESGTAAPWTLTSPSTFSVIIASKTTYSITGNFPQGGSFFAAFGGGGAAGGILTQAINLTPGTTYKASFLYGAYGVGGSEVQSIKAEAIDGALGGGAVLGTLNASDGVGSTNAATIFKGPFTFNFVAASNQAVIRFTDTTTSGANTDGFLDNVSVSAAAPEPSVIALAVVGMPFLAGLVRRRIARS